MQSSSADLPNDIDVLKRLVAERTAERDAASAKLKSAEAGLIAAALEAEKLKFELARLKRTAYACSRWEALTRYAHDGRLEISNNAAENAIRPVAMKESFCTSFASA